VSIEVDNHGQHTAGAGSPYLYEDVRRARLAVAANALRTDDPAADCRELLAMLGIDEHVNVLEES
jgi:hypothetical protein